MRTREKLKIIEKEVCALEFSIACLEELKKGFVEEANEISKAKKKPAVVSKKSGKPSKIEKPEKKAVKKAEKKPVKKVVKKTKRSK